jgi:[ribosomal protein S5]-alanine N-acetyltransferase
LELANRAYFAASISDRGDEFFNQFADRHCELLAEQETGIGAYYVLVAEDGSVLGRFNLYRFKDGTADLGYRVAQHVAGRGGRPRPSGSCAGWRRRGTGCVRSGQPRLARMPRPRGCWPRRGSVPVGPADIGGKQGTWYQRELAAG